MYQLAVNWNNEWAVAVYANERDRRVDMENMRKTALAAHDGKFELYTLQVNTEDPRPDGVDANGDPLIIKTLWHIPGAALLSGSCFVFTLP